MKKFEIGRVYCWADDSEPFVVMDRTEKTIWVVFEHNVVDNYDCRFSMRIKTGDDGVEYVKYPRSKYSVSRADDLDEFDGGEYYVRLTGLIPPRKNIPKHLSDLRRIYARMYQNVYFWERHEDDKPVLSNLPEDYWEDKIAGLTAALGSLHGVWLCIQEVVGEDRVYDEVDYGTFRKMFDREQELIKWKKEK